MIFSNTTIEEVQKDIANKGGEVANSTPKGKTDSSPSPSKKIEPSEAPATTTGGKAHWYMKIN